MGRLPSRPAWVLRSRFSGLSPSYKTDYDCRILIFTTFYVKYRLQFDSTRGFSLNLCNSLPVIIRKPGSQQQVYIFHFKTQLLRLRGVGQGTETAHSFIACVREKL